MQRHAVLLLISAVTTTYSATDSLRIQEVLDIGLNASTEHHIQELSKELAAEREGQAWNGLKPTLRAAAGLTHTWKKMEIQGFPQGYRWTADAGLTLAMPLYNAQAWSALELAKHGKEIDRLSTQMQRETLVLQLGSSYWAAVWTQESLRLQAQSLGNLERITSIVQIQMDNGLARRSDLNSATLAVRGVEAALASTRLQLRAQKNSLLKAMGRLPDTSIVLSGPLRATAPALQATSAPLPALALLQAQGRAKELEAQSSKDALLPSLSGFVKYGTQGNSDRFDLHSKPRERFSDNGMVGIQLDVPLFDGGNARASARIAQTERRQFELQEAKQRLDHIHEDAAARDALDVARQLVVKQEASVGMAQENFRLKEQEYKEQVAPISDLLRTESDLIAAQTSLLDALYRERLAELELLRVNGQLADHNR